MTSGGSRLYQNHGSANLAIKQAQLRQELIVRLGGAGTVWNGTEQGTKKPPGNGFRKSPALSYADQGPKWTMGLRMEKDPGETWLDDKRRPVISLALSAIMRGLLRKLIVGDYAGAVWSGEVWHGSASEQASRLTPHCCVDKRVAYFPMYIFR